MNPDAPQQDLPLADPADHPAALPVLVVEDDRPTRLLLERMIRARGHDVHGCESAEAAAELLREVFFPLIILDIQLPGMSGLEFSRLLRQQPTGKYYYILAGTGNNRPDDLRQVLDAGVDDYIAKPYHPGLLDIRLAVAEAAVKDIAERRHLEYDLAFLAEHDPLTKLYNRRRLPTAVGDAVNVARNGSPGALLYIDLDNFKVVNDTLGHDAGDRLLLAVAEVLRNGVRESDVLVRFGGDEFVIILSDCSVAEAMGIGEALRESIDDLVFAESGRSFRIGASIGVTQIDGLRSATDIISLADMACYAAKARGRNRVELHSENDDALANLVADADWSTRIKNAMTNGKLELYFQPIVAFADRAIICHEVLVRLLDHPEIGPVHPAAFMTSIQRSGFAARLDRFVITNAVAALAASDETALSINISASSFAADDFGSFVSDILEQNRISPTRVIFELTESEVLANVPRAVSTMSHLKGLGFRFALDDFGAGASSLNYLKSLPLDIIKIDGGFIRDLEGDPFNMAVIRSVHALSATLNIPMVAEHIETQSVCDILAGLGIQYGQGYLIGKPRTHPYRPDELFQDPPRTALDNALAES